VKDRHGEPLKKPARPVLAQGKVRHVGECVACVVADSANAAQDAAELIRRRVQRAARGHGRRKGARPGAAQLHAELPGTYLPFDWVAGDESATDAAFRHGEQDREIALENPAHGGPTRWSRAPASRPTTPLRRSTALYACTQGTCGAFIRSQKLARARGTVGRKRPSFLLYRASV